MRCEDEALIIVSPFENPGPGRAAAIADELRGKARRAEFKFALDGADGAAPTIQRVAAVEASPVGLARNSSASAPLCVAASDSRRTPTGIERAVADFADHRADGAAAQRFLHRPHQVAAVADRDGQQAFGAKREGVEAGAVRRAALGQRHVLGDPEPDGASAPASPSAKPVAAARWASPAAAISCSAPRASPPPSVVVDAGDAERQSARDRRSIPVVFCKACKFCRALAQLVEHR